MTLVRSQTEHADFIETERSGIDIRPLFAPIDEVLACGGDQRLELSRPSRQNVYGCTPYPGLNIMDFASSTASSISEEAYRRATAARDEYLARAVTEGAENAFENTITGLRRSLLAQLSLQNTGTEIIFAASGTDAQIHALFLAKTLLGASLTTIVVGSDQTGSGTAYTSRGQHFSDVTACGDGAGKGRPIAGLADRVRTLGIPFHAEGRFRTPAEMDDAVLKAVETAIAEGCKVLLQTMDASKFGWRAPSDGCAGEISRRWPGQVQVVVDACQLRISSDRLTEVLAKGSMVLLTGSKFFTGPAFSGALAVPRALCAKAARIAQAPVGLRAYTCAYDWPQAWAALRRRFPAKANFGQWLRWEAALEEMRLYHAMPHPFREEVRSVLASRIERLVAASPCLRLLRYDAAMDATMFPVLPHHNGVPLSAAQCAAIYRAMPRDLSGFADTDADRRAARALCQVGQPVPLAAGAALRISLSARIIRQCWSAQDGVTRVGPALEDIATLVEKLNFAIRHIGRIEAAAQ